MLFLHNCGIPDISEYRNSGMTKKLFFYFLIWLKEAIRSAGGSASKKQLQERLCRILNSGFWIFGLWTTPEMA